MAGDFLIVHKKIIPDFLPKVVEARALIDSGRVKGVSDAVRIVGISRSTYYKYKDYVFLPKDDTLGKKAVISMVLDHYKGILSQILSVIYQKRANVLTINQSIPINNQASVVVSLDISELVCPIGELIAQLSATKGANLVKLVAMG